MKFLSSQILLIVMIIGAAAGITACSSSSAETKKNATNANTEPAPVIDVTAAAAVTREVPEYFEATGGLVSDLQTDVAPTVGGKILEVNFDVGTYVQKGAVLVRLDDQDAKIRLDQAQAQVAQAQSQVNQYRASVEQAQANVKQVQARLGLSGNDVFNVNNIAEVRNAKTTLELAEVQLRRNERLLESGDVSRSSFDQVKAQRDQARSQYDATLNTTQQSFAGIRTAQAAVEQAQAQVTTGQRAVQSAQTQVEAARKAIADAVVYAPISGSILERSADPGEFIGTNNKVATIVRTNPLRVRIDVPEQSIGSIRNGQSVSLNTSSYPDRQFGGVIARIVPGLNATSRTLVAEAEVNNVDGLLKPGQFATVRVLLPQTRTAVMVPVSAVRSEGTSSRLFVINNNFAEQRLVQIGETENDLIEVSGNIKPDEKVAVSNVEKLADGVQVRQ